MVESSIFFLSDIRLLSFSFLGFLLILCSYSSVLFFTIQQPASCKSARAINRAAASRHM
ncbi:hypothetical protein ZOSMA_3G00700 [Zostera marina]|uniref:Uncharacterized protein n=1 Tax=Zostera marina TaxID=29655 RepID=A0A0K9P3M3_ZOSMR|nr:hypothetical protein ZOSMA_3G00700 [Zostera marina]